MAFEYWNSLPDAEKQEIVKQAEKAQEATGRHTCFWCGASLSYNGYGLTANANDPREICKGVCKGRRYFDNPEWYERML